MKCLHKAAAIGAVVVTAAGTLAGAGAASTAATGGPDRFGYSYADSDEPGGPVAGFHDISATGTRLDLAGDDATAPLKLPYSVKVYGTAYKQLIVSTNGNVQFTTESRSYTNQLLPFADLGVALVPLWDDLVVADGIFYEVDGVRGSRTFTIQWDVVPYSGGGNETSKFEVVLHEKSTQFEFRYGPVAGISLEISPVGGVGS